MKGIYCTLYNKTYLDKGLALYNSLEKVCGSFKLYVLAMDDECYDILKSISAPHMIPIRLSDFENEELLSVKSGRSFGEYCWTCSSSLIKYVILEYREEICTYIDADLYFYSDPIVLIDEMEKRGAKVLIVGHRYNKAYRQIEAISGKYCVQFNTFLNDKDSLRLLDIWIAQCIESVEKLNDGIHYGDQKYLDNWTNDYPFVVETENLGAGVAPWNIDQYTPEGEDIQFLLFIETGQPVNLVFYHFENITYRSDCEAMPNLKYSQKIDSHFINNLYVPYLQEIRSIKKLLRDEYGIDIIIKDHPAFEKQSKIKVFFNLIKDGEKLKKYLESRKSRKQLIKF